MTYKAKALARDCPYELLIFATITNRPADSIDLAGQRRVGDAAPPPHHLDQIVLADDALAKSKRNPKYLQSVFRRIRHPPLTDSPRVIDRKWRKPCSSTSRFLVLSLRWGRHQSLLSNRR